MFHVEQGTWLVLLFAAGIVLFGFVMFLMGFNFGQKSVRLVGQKTETYQPSERMTVTRTLAEEPGKIFQDRAPSSAEQTSPRSVVIPMAYRELIKLTKEGDN